VRKEEVLTLDLSDDFVHVALNCKQVCLDSLKLHLHVALVLLLILDCLSLVPVHQKFEVHLHLGQKHLHNLGAQGFGVLRHLWW
jgi:hypothetical protein